MRIYSNIMLFTLTCVLTAGSRGSFAAEKLRAFPGAEGFGAYSKGGRGGQVLFVSNLQDYLPGKETPIPGSLRLACSTKGPRTVLFRISGTIALKAPLQIKEPYLTLAGQSAPGDGVCLKNCQTVIETHDVIMRHIRFRPGDEMGIELDALWLADAQNVIIDHCSASWANDETLSVTRDSKNVTVQWCMITESLHNSSHHKGNHGYGSIIGGYDGGISFHHNIYAHNRSRNPRAAGYPEKSGPLVDLRNNVIYNWGDRAGYNSTNSIRINYVANYLKPGPSTQDGKYAFSIGGDATRMYAAGNILVGENIGAGDNWKLIRTKACSNKADTAFVVEPVTTQTAEEAYEAAIRDCGATLPGRDAVDSRVIDTIKTGKGRHIDSQKDVGGWPELNSTSPRADGDNDGMPDDWELKHRLNPKRAGNNDDRDNDGYTNIEEFLNGTNPNEK